ncbi:MAG: hypothetical protein AUI54_03995 [Acidobacteria bacterium 13_1_40CM_2_56_5]|nr:MAG: hypothetical protein AUI54_03995 [Acidobacteria bacterium 13_1_40CM_2_56_5]
MRAARFIALLLLISSTAILHAEVKADQKDRVQFEGIMGRMINLFGGKATHEGVIQTVAVKGNRKRTITDTNSQIVDLDEEKIYEIDMKNKTYRVMTFAELRRRMEEARQKAKEQSPPEAAEPSGKSQKTPDIQIDFNLKPSGQQKNINGYDCRELVMTISVHEKGKPLEQGGMVLTAHDWIAPKIAAMKEIDDFTLRFYQKLAGPYGFGDPEQMAAVMAANPFMKDAIEKFQKEAANLDGTSILLNMTVEVAAPPEESAQLQKVQEREPKTDITSVRGVLGGLGRRIGRKNDEKKEEPQTATPGRVGLMSMNHELVRISTDVSDADLAIPAGFKETGK